MLLTADHRRRALLSTLRAQQLRRLLLAKHLLAQGAARTRKPRLAGRCVRARERAPAEGGLHAETAQRLHASGRMRVG